MNCMFSMKFILPSNRFIFWNIRNSFGDILERLSLAVAYEVIHTLQCFVGTEQKSLILSKAATHCLSFLCDIESTKQEAIKHLLAGIDNRRRKETAWLWRMRASPRVFERKAFLCGTLLWSRPRSIIQTYGQLADAINKNYFPIYSFSSFDWASRHSNTNEETQAWHIYMSFLEYLPQILRHAGHYTPLIDICKTKSLAPMSMMFPALSRRARRAIARYLERME